MLTSDQSKRVSELAVAAGEQIMSHYRCLQEGDVSEKQDLSPITVADLAAHNVLADGLPDILKLAVLSEEGGIPTFNERKQWGSYWLIDPLDGTKEFVDGMGGFTVNVALVESGRVSWGLVYAPVSGALYMGGRGVAATKNGVEISVRPLPGKVLKSLGSRRHQSEQELAVAERLAAGREVELFSMGSSLKFCAIAEGAADTYVRLGPTSEWDTAAAQAVLEAAGGAVVTLDGAGLTYNSKESLLNPSFVALGDPVLLASLKAE